MAPPWFTIIGTGRSGTKYMAELMRANGLNCGHESYYSPIRMESGDQDESLDGDSSWLAVPYLEQDVPRSPTIHVTRNPVAVVKSLLEIRFFHPETEEAPFRQFLWKYSNIFQHEDPVVRAVEFWVEWNTRCKYLSDVTMPIEQLDYHVLSDLLKHQIYPQPLSRDINHAPESLQAGRVPDNTPNHVIVDYLRGRQKAFGY